MRKTFFLLLFLLSACKYTRVHINEVNDRKAAEKAVDQLYLLLSQKKIDAAMRLFRPTYLWSIDTTKLRIELTNLSAISPFLVDRKLDHWQTKVFTGLESPSGFYSRDEYDFYYINKYKNGIENKVSITFKKDLTDDLLISAFDVRDDKSR